MLQHTAEFMKIFSKYIIHNALKELKEHFLCLLAFFRKAQEVVLSIREQLSVREMEKGVMEWAGKRTCVVFTQFLYGLNAPNDIVNRKIRTRRKNSWITKWYSPYKAYRLRKSVCLLKEQGSHRLFVFFSKICSPRHRRCKCRGQRH